MNSELTEKIEALIRRNLEEISAELVEFNIKRRGRTVVIDIIADKPNGGITIGECASVNKGINRAIEKKRWLDDNYIVEVASPGLDRTLKTPRDFERVLGRRVRVHLLEAVEGKVEHHGDVAEVNEDQILIRTNEKIIIIPLKYISKAVQVIE